MIFNAYHILFQIDKKPFRLTVQVPLVEYHLNQANQVETFNKNEEINRIIY